MAKHLAKQIGYRYIDSGAMYRAVTLAALRAGLFTAPHEVNCSALEALLPTLHIDFQPGENGQTTLLNGEPVEAEIRDLEVAEHVSYVAEIPAVRHHLVAMQRAYGKQGGIVMDGRDIGTTVFPHAEMKIFVTANPEHRAHRRLRELEQKGVHASYDEVLANVLERDYVDQHRTESPLRRADDAFLLDNSEMTEEEQLNWLLSIYTRITESGE